jgi:hypothetical protein
MSHKNKGRLSLVFESFAIMVTDLSDNLQNS